MSIKSIILFLNSSLSFLLSLLLEYILYKRNKKDDSLDYYFYSIIICRIMDKYKIHIIKVILFFTKGAEATTIQPIEEYKRSFSKLKGNNKKNA